MLKHFSLKSAILLCVGFILEVQGGVTDTEYALMPPLFHLDDFDRCMILGEKALYCSITAQLEPIDAKHPSRVWKIIQEVISKPMNYRHDRLRHGICVPYSCPNALVNITSFKTNNEFLQEELSRCYTNKYSKLGLKSIVTEMRCETPEPVRGIDIYDKLVASFLLIVFAIVVIGSFYEGCARYKTKEEYNMIMATTAGKMLACFSIPKNWERLRSISDSPDAIALRPINSIRFYNMFLVIMAHTCMVTTASPMHNPQYFERITDNPLNMFMVNGGFSIQTYFVMAAWLLSYHFFLTIEGKDDVRLWHILVAFFKRYIRLTPSLLVTIAISSTWLYHLGRGPSWERIVGDEVRRCRINWWSNLLYINNYYDSEHMCLQQTWYLATDTQLFALSLVILMLMWKYQHRIKLILGTSLVIGILIPGIINYVNDYDIILRAYPEDLYETQLKNWHWHSTYTPVYTNIGGYVIGLIFGYIFYKYRSQQLLTKKVKTFN
ncbi:hypothetical protein ILUMI_21864 [Ignelater luminosus]|uniref:Acyltransferase 3 domain-containing protein n=1 Tax=Ignelater luminosus TaxID=2038154 RepID=A0A8K0CHW8_IGNLU|nr:hypothetical protein ILUMI_21864 [Ignelater luminosus]